MGDVFVYWKSRPDFVRCPCLSLTLGLSFLEGDHTQHRVAAFGSQVHVDDWQLLTFHRDWLKHILTTSNQTSHLLPLPACLSNSTTTTSWSPTAGSRRSTAAWKLGSVGPMLTPTPPFLLLLLLPLSLPEVDTSERWWQDQTKARPHLRPWDLPHHRRPHQQQLGRCLDRLGWQVGLNRTSKTKAILCFHSNSCIQAWHWGEGLWQDKHKSGAQPKVRVHCCYFFLKLVLKSRILKSFETATDVHLYSHDNALVMLERRLAVKESIKNTNAHNVVHVQQPRGEPADVCDQRPPLPSEPLERDQQLPGQLLNNANNISHST